MKAKEKNDMRLEHDLLGEMMIPDNYYFGIQTLRAVENFNITPIKLNSRPEFIKALALVKKAAALANCELKLMPKKMCDAIVKACDEVAEGNFDSHFVVDMVQGGAGTSTNMNANEVIANRALEILGHKRGEYQYCHPNNHINMSQSTNDAYPTSAKLSLLFAKQRLLNELQLLINSFNKKGEEFTDVIKMGRTQMQDAVPITLGQEFDAYAANLREEIERINQNANLFLEINMGATAIGTGINADPDYTPICVRYMREVTDMPFVAASNLIEATNDTGAFVIFSAAVKRLAVKLSKICNDLRLMSSGPRTGFGEINLPAMQPGSTIMPGKVNPVIPEVVNQIAFKVIGNDVTVTMASQGAQLELNAFEPMIIHSLFESIEMLINGMNTLRVRCIDGITANVEHCKRMVYNSIGLITALNPYLGYEASTELAKIALEENRGVYELILERNLMTKEELDNLLKPENMVKSRKIINSRL